MTNNFRVSNLSRPGYTCKMRQAEKAVEACSAAWVEYGVSIRDLTLAESLQARNEQARLREPLPLAEVPGLVYEPAPGALNGYLIERGLAWQASVFAATGEMSAA